MPIVSRLQKDSHYLTHVRNEGSSGVSCHFTHSSDGSLLGFEKSCANMHHHITFLVFLVGLSATTTLARLPIGRIRSHPRAHAFLHDVMDEVVKVARAEGVPLPPEYAENRLAFADTLPETMSSSMHHDLERGNRLELPWLSGDVVERGRRLGVPTPCNRAVVDMLSLHADGRRD